MRGSASWLARAIAVAALVGGSAARASEAPTAATGAPAAGADARADAYFLYCLSRQAMYQQDFEGAVDYLRRALGADPGSVELAVDLARLHLDLDQPAEAAEAARRAVAAHPDAAEARAVLAEAIFQITQRDGAGSADQQAAIEAYRALLSVNPNDAPAWLNLARLLAARGSLQESLEAVAKHLEIDPASEEGVYLASQILARLDRLEEAQRLLEAALARTPASPQLTVALSEVHERRGDYEGAVRVAQQLMGQRVDPLRVHFILARLYQRMGRHSDAHSHLARMAAIMDERPGDYGEEDRAEIRLRMIRALIQADRPAEAIAQADQGAASFPSEVRFILRKGEALLMAGRIREAEGLFRERIALSNGDTALLGMVSETYLSVGASREQAGDLATAEAHLRKAIDLDPLNHAALNYLGYMLADQGRLLDEAIGLIRRALEREPDNGAYLDSLGWAYFKKGDYGRSMDALESARAAMAEEPTIHAHLGELYFAMGRTEEAVKAWQEAIDRGAENADDIRARLDAATRVVAPTP